MPYIATADKRAHQVTKAWHDANVVPFPEIAKFTLNQHEKTRKQLLAISNQRALTTEERNRLKAHTNWVNVNKAWTWLAGRELSEFGFETLDQVHGNACTHACGCQTQHVFDHNKAQAGEHAENHPHFPRKSCVKHAVLAKDFKAHFVKVHADNKAQHEAAKAAAAKAALHAQK